MVHRHFLMMIMVLSLLKFYGRAILMCVLLEPDGGIEVVTVWVMIRVESLSRRELFLMVSLGKRQISHHRGVPQQSMHRGWHVIILAVALASISETTICC